MFVTIPTEILYCIADNLSTAELACLAIANKHLHHVLTQPLYSRAKDFQKGIELDWPYHVHSYVGTCMSLLNSVHLAAYRGYEAALEKLLDIFPVDTPCWDDITPLTYAVLGGHPATVKLLLQEERT
ncbi:hypothetical protein K440DRAFT_239387 [Wilcoxina mikolae CBS 423.85]|nr:hypothetical protein K440DRAFT_239387 [Wilcoxina mikolae CBS 423.85]